jgi:hypothetical protein
VTQAASADQEQNPKLGVLFVHGIGDQQQYSTLARFGGALQRWLSRWAEAGRQPPGDGDRIAPAPLVDVVSVEHHPASGAAPAHATMVLQGSRPQTWVLAEAWWASEVTPPRFRDFVRWVLPMFPWLAAEYPIAATRRADPEDPPPSLHGRNPTWLENVTLSGLLWLASPVIAVVLMVVCLLLALLQRLPVVGKWVSARTVGLVKGLGDAYLFAHDALARTAMIQRIQQNLRWLREQQHCEQVAVVAHSQGAALSHDMLRSGHRPEPPVDLLVTVGSGVQRLDGFRQLYQDARLRSLGWGSIAGLTMLVAGIFLALAGLGMPGVPGLWATLGIGLILAGALLPGIVWTTNRRGRLRPLLDHRWGAATAGLGALALLVAGVNSSGSAEVRLSAGGLLMAAGIAAYGWAYHAVERQVMQHPRLALPASAVGRWVDYYATADPVPNGPLRTWTGPVRPTDDRTQVHPLPRVVYNLRSVQADHSFYFDNLDEFVSKLALNLTAAAGLDLGQLGGQTLTGARARRRWRTACRSNVRNLLLLAGLLGAGAISLRLGGGRGWAGLGADLGVQPAPPYGSLLGRAAHAVLDWLGKRPFLGALKGIDLPLFSGVLVAAAAVVLAAFALGWLWSTWDQGAIERFFDQRQGRPARSGSRPRRSLPGVAGAWLEAAWGRLPAVSFLTLPALLVAGTAVVVQRYAGAWWLWLAFLGFGLFTAALTVERWWVCLGPTPKAAKLASPTIQPERAGV